MARRGGGLGGTWLGAAMRNGRCGSWSWEQAHVAPTGGGASELAASSPGGGLDPSLTCCIIPGGGPAPPLTCSTIPRGGSGQK